MVIRFHKLFTRENVRKSADYIKEHGLPAFLRKAKGVISIALADGKGAAILKTPDEKKKPGSIWDNSTEQYQKGGFKLYWELLPDVQHYQHAFMTGDKDKDYFSYVIELVREQIGSSGLNALSLGCVEGDPGPEMTLSDTGLFEKITVLDVAEGLLDKQRALAAKKGLNRIDYMLQDLNVSLFHEDSYDLIWAIGTIHHVQNLEHLFDQINNALKDKGLFVMREYIGPNRIQFSEEQIDMVNEILSILPDKYKTLFMDGIIKNVAERPDIEELKRLDPSESVRSEEIMQVMQEKLDIVKLSYTGGTILHPLLSGIASNFERDEDARAILRIIIMFERILTERAVIPSDYVFCIARKK